MEKISRAAFVSDVSLSYMLRESHYCCDTRNHLLSWQVDSVNADQWASGVDAVAHKMPAGIRNPRMSDSHWEFAAALRTRLKAIIKRTIAKIDRVFFSAHSETKNKRMLLRKPRAQSDKRSPNIYQSIDGRESPSDSAGKLAALRLDRLQRPGTELPLEGFSVLDIGCNEGFFCLEALKLGAARVTGIDENKNTIERARKNCPDAEFVHGSWWDLPDERFDLILFLSAIHYERQEKRLLDMLCEHLHGDGTLILECGIAADNHGGSGWRQIRRDDGYMRYPTREHLIRNLLSSYSVRALGRSVDQKGDPMPRAVFHCRRRRSMALLIIGTSETGKTTLADSLAANAVPTYKVDRLFNRLFNNPLYSGTELVSLIEKSPNRDCAAACRDIIAKGCAADLAQAIAAEVPSECRLFCIEGEALSHDEVRSPLKDALAKRGVDIWVVSREQEDGV